MIAAQRCTLSLLLPALFFIAPVMRAQVPPLSTTYPQIVRLSLVEGDVRVSRGEGGEKATGSVWEKAALDVPLESGFSLVTGTGRAEIELEDASTIYLADNSVLTFKDLSSTEGVPFTSLALLSGSMTLHLLTTHAGEEFYVATPGGAVHLGDRSEAFVRVDSYLDAMALTPQEDGKINVAGVPLPAIHGQTSVYRDGRRVSVNVSSDPGPMAGWDKWVADRVTARNVAMTSAMKASGLSAPVPGLAEMNGQGRFFACEPYGTCWEPANGWSGHGENAGQTAPSDAAHLQTAMAQSGSSLPARPRRLWTEEDDYFPCTPNMIRRFYEIDPLTLKPRLVDTQYDYEPYRWAVCHTGSWLHGRRGYVWVVGTKRHHQCPVHWVKAGGKTGYVPIHPRDVKGKPPVNLQHGVYALTDHKQGVERIKFDPSEHVKVLENEPKEFRKDYFAPLQRAEAPRAEAHPMHEAMLASKEGGPMKAVGTAITFDHKSQSFMMERQVMQGGRTSTVSEPVGGRDGNLQARGGDGGGFSHGGGGSYSGGGGSRSGSSGYSGGGGGGSRGSSSGGGGYSGGGGGHSGGGSAGGGYSGGGGGHSGGGASGGGGSGGGASSAPSAPSSSGGGGAAAPSAGAHK